MWKCDRRIWRGLHGKLYEDGDPRAQALVATAGDELESKPVVEKALKPAEDKAVKPSENKGRGVKKEAPEPFPGLDEDPEDAAPGN